MLKSHNLPWFLNLINTIEMYYIVVRSSYMYKQFSLFMPLVNIRLCKISFPLYLKKEPHQVLFLGKCCFSFNLGLDQ